MKLWVTLLVLSSFITSCQKEVNFEEYLKDIQESGVLIKERKFGDFVLKAKYKPYSYIVAMEIKNGLIKTDKQIAERIESLEGYYYYDLLLDIEGDPLINIINWKLKDEKSKQERIHYLNFLMKQDLHLEVGENEIPCSVYHFERNYGVSKHKKIVLGFKKKDNNKLKEQTLVFNSEILGIGKIKLHFDKEIIEQEHELKL